MIRWPFRWPWGRKAPLPLSRAGEEMAADWLRKRGMSILANNLRLGRYELDIVARDGDTVVFVEVKTRRDASVIAPELNVNYRKRTHIRRAAQVYIQQHGQPDDYYRFDVISVVIPENGGARVEHIPDAFGAREGLGNSRR